MAYDKLSSLLFELTEKKVIPAISLAVGYNGKMVFSKAFGKIYECNKPITTNTRFDVASITKILTGICFMKFVERKKIQLEDSICEIFPEFDQIKTIEKAGIAIDYCDCSKITWFHVLTHTSGMGWTRQKTRPSLPHLDRGLEDIYSLPLAYRIGEHIIYSDIPIILMGKAMEWMSGKKIDSLVKEIICEPLGLKNTGFIRTSIGINSKNNIAPTEFDEIFRKRRIWGEVHDENAYLMDGVSAHAGIFSTAEDLCCLAMNYNNCLKRNGILKKETAELMIAEQVEEDGDRRGLIWQLSGRKQNSYTRNLSSEAYGHTGFTGCFVWNDPKYDLSIVLLSNDVYNGRENRKLFGYREQIIQHILKELDI